ELSDVVRRSFEGRGYRETRQRLVDAAHHLPPPLRERRVDHAIGVLVMSLAAMEGLPPGRVPTAVAIADLTDTCTAIVEAPASPTTLALLDDAADRSA